MRRFAFDGDRRIRKKDGTKKEEKREKDEEIERERTRQRYDKWSQVA